jgi:pimeloyl-ACP methyl ester carboxylesterase
VSVSNPKTFVLVHGAWHGGWCWRRVAERLRAHGHVVYTPTLTGVGERSHLLSPDIDLDLQITDVVNVMKWEDLTDVVLVGHSYGGFVISGVAERMEQSISSIVYLDAFLPENGEALADNWSPERARQLAEDAAAGIPASPVPVAYYHVNEQDQAWVDSKCTPHPPKCFLQPIKLTGARNRIARKTYVYADAWPSHFTPFYEKARRDSSWRTATIPCGHEVMIDMPERTAEILEEAA